MNLRVTPALALIIAAAWLGGCGSSAAPSAPRSATAAATALTPSPTVACAAPAATGPLRPHQPRRLALPGSPDGIATTPDGQTSFVALQSGAPRVAVIANAPGGPRLLRTVGIPAYASGMRVSPDGRYALAAAGSGAVVLDVAAARSGTGAPVRGWLRAPARIAGSGPGAAEVAVSRDSRHVFVTLEGAGVIAVFDLRGMLSGGSASGYLGAVPVGSGALGITLSADGRRLYEVSESAPVAGRRGALHLIDVTRALRTPRDAVLATASAPCAPVRVAASPNGAQIWVTARGADALLGYSSSALARTPGRALRSVTGVGASPLGLAVVEAGRRVLVADADLADPHRLGSAVSVVAAGPTPSLLATVASGRLADAIAPAAGARALVTDSDGRALQVLSLVQLP